MFFFPASGCKPNIQASNGHQGGTNAGALQHRQRHRDFMQKAQALQDHLLLLPGPHVPRVDLSYSGFPVISSGVYVDMYGYVVFIVVFMCFSAALEEFDHPPEYSAPGCSEKFMAGICCWK